VRETGGESRSNHRKRREGSLPRRRGGHRTSPAVGFLSGSGVKIGIGIVVDDYFRTSVPNIYARRLRELFDKETRPPGSTWVEKRHQTGAPCRGEHGGRRKRYIPEESDYFWALFGLPSWTASGSFRRPSCGPIEILRDNVVVGGDKPGKPFLALALSSFHRRLPTPADGCDVVRHHIVG